MTEDREMDPRELEALRMEVNQERFRANRRMSRILAEHLDKPSGQIEDYLNSCNEEILAEESDSRLVSFALEHIDWWLPFNPEDISDQEVKEQFIRMVTSSDLGKREQMLLAGKGYFTEQLARSETAFFKARTLFFSRIEGADEVLKRVKQDFALTLAQTYLLLGEQSLPAKLRFAIGKDGLKQLEESETHYWGLTPAADLKLEREALDLLLEKYEDPRDIIDTVLELKDGKLPV